LSDRSLCDLELLAIGAFSPLSRFLNRADYERVLGEMRLADGTLWPMPVTLPVQEAEAPALDSEIALRDGRNELIAVMRVEEAFRWSRQSESLQLLGSSDERHPLVAEQAS